MNEQIRVPEVRLIDGEGKQLGIKTTAEALLIAKRQNLDLVEVAGQAQPPVCKIMDYGKFKFQLSKKVKDGRKSSKGMTVKELKFGLKIDPNDFETKCKNAQRFLEEGHRVKIIIMFRGREIQYKDRGEMMRKRIHERMDASANFDNPGNLEGNNIIMILGPKPRPVERKAEAAAAPTPAPAPVPTPTPTSTTPPAAPAV